MGRECIIDLGWRMSACKILTPGICGIICQKKAILQLKELVTVFDHLYSQAPRSFSLRIMNQFKHFTSYIHVF